MNRPTAQRPMLPLEPMRLAVWAILTALLVAGAFTPGRAAELYAGDDISIRWDNTVRYSAGFRVSPRDHYYNYEPNNDDGDRDFSPGPMSNRLDLLSVLNISRDNFGVQASIAAWYDTVYHGRTDNNSPATYNPTSMPDFQFARATRDLHGQHAEIGDTFAYGTFSLEDVPVSVRIGRQTLLWGESLFFSHDGIAATQAPVDYTKSYISPGGYSKNVFLPVNQISLSVQPRSDLTLAFYYQLEWRPARLPGVGSYFSYVDFLGAGSERILLGPEDYLHHGKDRSPRDGQFGVSLHANFDDLDVGFYALKYNAKYPVVRFAANESPASSANDLGVFNLVYPSGIELYGASFSTYAGDATIAGEFSARRHMPLTVRPLLAPYAGAYYAGNGYPEGDTLHAQFSTVATFAPARVWDSADLNAEFTANYLIGVTRGASAVDPSRDRFAASARLLFEPRYFETLPNLDISFPVGLGVNIAGRSSVDYTQNGGTGDFEMGVAATYRSVWKASLTLTSFWGGPDSQPLTDRDFVLLSIERTF